MNLIFCKFLVKISAGFISPGTNCNSTSLATTNSHVHILSNGLADLRSDAGNTDLVILPWAHPGQMCSLCGNVILGNCYKQYNLLFSWVMRWSKSCCTLSAGLVILFISFHYSSLLHILQSTRTITHCFLIPLTNHIIQQWPILLYKPSRDIVFFSLLLRIQTSILLSPSNLTSWQQLYLSSESRTQLLTVETNTVS